MTNQTKRNILFAILAAIGAYLLSSCNKNWSCTVTNNGVEAQNSYDFHGTTEEKNQHELEGTNTFIVSGQTFDQETNCIND